MDSSMMVGIAVGAGVAMLVASKLQRKKNDKLVPSIEAALRAQGALTLPALTEAVGMKGFTARGKVAMALSQLVTNGVIETIAAPEGTPQLQKINFIKYQLRG
jgi:hypothetical protein